MKSLNHIAFIMDGNGTWAKKQGLPRLAGHKAGVESLGKIIDIVRDLDIHYITVYAFSTENWNRSKEEVKGIMNLLREYLKSDDIKKLDREGVRIRVLGNRDDERIPKDILKAIHEIEEKTKDNSNFNFNIAFNYGGRREIVDAIKRIPADKIQSLDEESFAKYLYDGNIPDPDLIVRTSGQVRTSNFLLWQSAYSEYIFTDVLWPDFGKEELNNCILKYQNRERKFGKVC